MKKPKKNNKPAKPLPKASKHVAIPSRMPGPSRSRLTPSQSISRSLGSTSKPTSGTASASSMKSRPRKNPVSQQRDRRRQEEATDSEYEVPDEEEEEEEVDESEFEVPDESEEDDEAELGMTPPPNEVATKPAQDPDYDKIDFPKDNEGKFLCPFAINRRGLDICTHKSKKSRASVSPTSRYRLNIDPKPPQGYQNGARSTQRRRCVPPDWALAME